MKKSFSDSQKECQKVWQELKKALYNDRHDLFKYILGAIVMFIILCLFGRIK